MIYKLTITMNYSLLTTFIFCTVAPLLVADDALFDLLKRIDNKKPVEANLLRVEAQTLLDSQRSNKKFPADELVGFILDTAQNPDGRVLALDILEEHDPQRAASLDRQLIDDPVGGLRYNVVARIIKRADQLLENEQFSEAATIYHALLVRAAALDQTAAIVRALLKINNKKPLSELGIEYGGAKDAGYLVHWEVSEPYENPDNKGLDTVYPPEQTNIVTNSLTWKPMETDNIDGKLNLFPFTDKKTNVSLYARTILESPVAQTVSIRYSTQKTGKVWLNGTEIGCFPLNDDGGDVPDKYVMGVELQAGQNVLLVKNTRYSETPPAGSSPAGSSHATGSGTNAPSYAPRPNPPGDTAPTTQEGGTPSPRRTPSGGASGYSGGGMSMMGGMGGWLFQVRICNDKGIPFRVAGFEKQRPLPDSVFVISDTESYSETKKVENSVTSNSDTKLPGKESSAVPFMQFRGAACNPVLKTVSCGEKVFDKEPIWKTLIPGEGVSSPIIVKDRIIVTSADGAGENRLHTTAYDLGTGQKIWRRTLKATGSLLCYRPFSSVAANTPASDGEYIVAFFSSNDLVCFSPDGTLCWYRPLGLENPKVIVSVGMAASPLIVDKTLIVQCQSNAESFAEAMDISTGKTIWKTERPKGQGWSSPTVLFQKDGSKSIVFVDRTGCSVHSLATGEKLTTYEGKCALTSSPVCVDETVYFSLGGTTALRYGVTEKTPEILWTEPKLSVGSPSPVIDGNKLYIIKSPGVLICADRISGTIFWQTRLSGSFYATPIIVGNHLIAASQQGMIYHVLLNDEKGEMLEDIELGEEVLSTPAVSDNSILIRSKKSLYRFRLL
ncbi:MAG: PQQ-binding-like beta-propeller repeat protein [Planctomycetaceae bacterium]|jgi:outer membrane protein assembly factor BamB|nr:PQQ-binding-like beta-propeller repeat protein [Planctomycetaceae bacterium]